MPYEIITETAKVYRVRYRKAEGEKPRFEYCEATVRPFPGGGSLAIQSSYGTFAYTWGATGDGPFLSFLLDLDFDYFMGKARPGYREFDAEATIAELRRMVIRARREGWGGISDREKGREAWDFLAEMDPVCQSAEYFLSELLRCDLISEMVGGDYDFCRQRPNPNARGFWQELWPVLCDHWRQEITPPAISSAA